MRNYWLRILGGAFAIFAIGMIGVTLVRHGMAKVNSVMTSDAPITIPLPFVPFMLSGERLGKLDHLRILRDEPRRLAGVELAVDLSDSLVAEGLRNCRLAANLESDSAQPGLNIQVSDRSHSAFWCLSGDSVPKDLVEFGHAVFQPADVRVPLFVQQELVDELQNALADSSAVLTEEQTDSIASAAEIKADSAVAAAVRSADSIGHAGRRLGDSLREEGLRRADSIRAELRHMADTMPRR
jgi:hypothetical protein